MISLLKRSAAVLFGAILSIGAFPMTASAETISAEDTPVDPSASYIFDEADMLNTAEEEDLTARIQETAEYIDMNILIYVSGTSIYSEAGTLQFAEEVCVENYGYDADSIVLYMDLSGHDNPYYSPYDYMYTRNRARFYYSGYSDLDDGGRVQNIFDAMNPYLPRCEEDVYTAAGIFLEKLRSYYDRGPDKSVRYFYVPDLDKYVTLENDGTLVFDDSRPKNWGKAALIGVLVGLVVAVIVFLCVKLHYRFKSRPSSLQYMDFGNAKMGQRTDMFIRKYQTRTRIQSSSGGGSGGGGGGGTRSGGGGGGNRR